MKKETYRKVTGRNPARYDLGPFRVKGSKYKYMLYPSNMISHSADTKNVPITLTISAK